MPPVPALGGGVGCLWSPGGFFDPGGIEIIDLDSLQSLGLVVREADGLTGADLGPFVMTTPDRGYLAYSTDLTISSHLHGFSVAGGVDPLPLHTAVSYLAPALEFEPLIHRFFFPNGGSLDDGVHVFDAATGARLTAEVAPTGGPPTDLVLLCGHATATAPDFDCDGDVDADDLNHFLGCASGPAVVLTESACLNADLDADGDADASDFAVLQRCLAGSELLLDTGCAD